MKTRISSSVIMIFGALVLFTSCVSSKKYKASQASLQQVRADSSKLSQQVASLNQNVQGMEEKNTVLQRSLDSNTAIYASQQKSLDYYQTYFDKQQTSLSQLTQQIKDALTQANVTMSESDLQQNNGILYINLDDNNVFKKNSTAVTKTGDQVLNSIATVLRSHNDVKVTVDNAFEGTSDTSAMGSNASTYNSDANNATASSRPHKKSGSSSMRKSSSQKASTNADASSTAASNSNNSANGTAAKTSTAKSVKKAAPRKYSSETKSLTYTSGSHKRNSAAWVLKYGRANMAAKGLLHHGLSKVNIATQQEPAGFENSQQKNILKVVVTPVMTDFAPVKNSSVSKQ
jgi:chemotaxis protein MotB